MSFHKSNYGKFGGGFVADIDGYVHETVKEVMGGNWDEISGKMTRGKAMEIVAENREAKKEADAALTEWQSANA